MWNSGEMIFIHVIFVRISNSKALIQNTLGNMFINLK